MSAIASATTDAAKPLKFFGRFFFGIMTDTCSHLHNPHHEFQTDPLPNGCVKIQQFVIPIVVVFANRLVLLFVHPPSQSDQSPFVKTGIFYFPYSNDSDTGCRDL